MERNCRQNKAGKGAKMKAVLLTPKYKCAGNIGNVMFDCDFLGKIMGCHKIGKCKYQVRKIKQKGKVE